MSTRGAQITTTTSSQAIPAATRRVLIHDAALMPQDYSTTPGGTLFSTTPGGNDPSWAMRMMMVAVVDLGKY